MRRGEKREERERRNREERRIEETERRTEETERKTERRTEGKVEDEGKKRGDTLLQRQRRQSKMLFVCL